MPECHIKGTTVKYIRIPDEVTILNNFLTDNSCFVCIHRFLIKLVKPIKNFVCNKLNFVISVTIVVAAVLDVVDTTIPTVTFFNLFSNLFFYIFRTWWISKKLSNKRSIKIYNPFQLNPLIFSICYPFRTACL